MGEALMRGAAMWLIAHDALSDWKRLTNLSPAAPDKATAPTLSGASVGQGDNN
jgi:hypothetical protein